MVRRRDSARKNQVAGNDFRHGTGGRGSGVGGRAAPGLQPQLICLVGKSDEITQRETRGATRCAHTQRDPVELLLNDTR